MVSSSFIEFLDEIPNNNLAVARDSAPIISGQTQPGVLLVRSAFSLLLLPALLLLPVTSEARSKRSTPITQAEVESAQAAWCSALVDIGKVSASGGDAKAKANEVLSTAYAYDTGTVLFKPTLTHGEQTFRMTKAGALAYFVGGDASFPDDKGFALKEWVSCTPEVKGVVAQGDMALAMGNIHLQNKAGDKVTVDKSFGYVRGDGGALRIVLHHSSLPVAK